MDAFRHSGLPGVGCLPWGTHACLIYEQMEDLAEIVGQYVRAGIDHHECCLWIVPPSLSHDQARDLLEEVLPGSAEYVAKEQLSIASASAWYRNGDGLDCEKAFRGFSDSLDRAVTGGFAGLRCIGGPGPIDEPDDWQRFLAYEAACNQPKDDCRILGLCTYAFQDCTAAQLLDLMQRHQASLIKRNGQWGFIEHAELRTALIVKEQADRFRRVKEALPIGIYETDREGHCTYLNECCSRMIGLSQDEALGEGWAKALHPADRERLLDHWQDAVKRQVPFQAEYRFRRPDGSILWVLGQKVPLRDATGELFGYVGTIADITEQKLIQETLESNVKARTRQLAEVNASLMEKIRDLEQFHDVVVGRELRMMQLEKELEHLRAQRAT